MQFDCVSLYLNFCVFSIWYTLGVSEQETVYGWYRTMSNHVLRNQSGTHNVSKSMAYLTSMYFTLSCMTSVGFGTFLCRTSFWWQLKCGIAKLPCTVRWLIGNVSANTELEKLFTIFLMVLGGEWRLPIRRMKHCFVKHEAIRLF